jgi:hypothetical protein
MTISLGHKINSNKSKRTKIIPSVNSDLVESNYKSVTKTARRLGMVAQCKALAQYAQDPEFDPQHLKNKNANRTTKKNLQTHEH